MKKEIKITLIILGIVLLIVGMIGGIVVGLNHNNSMTILKVNIEENGVYYSEPFNVKKENVKVYSDVDCSIEIVNIEDENDLVSIGYLTNGMHEKIKLNKNKTYRVKSSVENLEITITNSEKIDEKIISNDECCEGCLCGDTLQLLKNTETAWTLTTIDNNGNYIYDHNSFINFHGTGKNRFAFFKNDENGNNISEIKGTINITRNADIILEQDNSNKKITCKIGEEKNLISVLECDNNFGTFTLQKQGTLELPNVITDTVKNTQKIVITGNKNKTITDENDIKSFISIISNSKVWTGPVNEPSPNYHLELYANNKIIAKIEYNKEHYFDIEINSKHYSLINIDKELLNQIIEK